MSASSIRADVGPSGLLSAGDGMSQADRIENIIPSMSFSTKATQIDEILRILSRTDLPSVSRTSMSS